MFASLSWVRLSKTEDGLGCPLRLVNGSVCVGGGPLIKLFVMGFLWCVAERGCGAGVVLCRCAKFVGSGCLRDSGAPLREPIC
jgi:hypothetical protein